MGITKQSKEADRIETAAMLLHAARHPAGTAQICGACRAEATSSIIAAEELNTHRRADDAT